MRTPPIRYAPAAATLVAIAALAGALLLAAPGGARPAAALTLDGKTFRPELALTSAARVRGLMNRKVAPADGMLFVFPRPTSSGFWMKNTRVPLTIVFFDASGERVRRISMTPCRRDPCRIYDPGHMYRFALELRASDPRLARRLGTRTALKLLVAQAS